MSFSLSHLLTTTYFLLLTITSITYYYLLSDSQTDKQTDTDRHKRALSYGLVKDGLGLLDSWKLSELKLAIWVSEELECLREETREFRTRGDAHVPLLGQGRVKWESEVSFVSARKAVTWRHEVVMVRGSSQHRYRDLKTGRFVRKP